MAGNLVIHTRKKSSPPPPCPFSSGCSSCSANRRCVAAALTPLRSSSSSCRPSSHSENASINTSPDQLQPLQCPSSPRTPVPNLSACGTVPSTSPSSYPATDSHPSTSTLTSPCGPQQQHSNQCCRHWNSLLAASLLCIQLWKLMDALQSPALQPATPIPPPRPDIPSLPPIATAVVPSSSDDEDDEDDWKMQLDGLTWRLDCLVQNISRCLGRLTPQLTEMIVVDSALCSEQQPVCETHTSEYDDDELPGTTSCFEIEDDGDFYETGYYGSTVSWDPQSSLVGFQPSTQQQHPSHHLIINYPCQQSSIVANKAVDQHSLMAAAAHHHHHLHIHTPPLNPSIDRVKAAETSTTSETHKAEAEGKTFSLSTNDDSRTLLSASFRDRYNLINDEPKMVNVESQMYLSRVRIPRLVPIWDDTLEAEVNQLRYKELTQVRKALHDLCELQQCVATRTTEVQEHLDKAEGLLDTTNDETRGANVELAKANKARSSWWSLKASGVGTVGGVVAGGLILGPFGALAAGSIAGAAGLFAGNSMQKAHGAKMDRIITDNKRSRRRSLPKQRERPRQVGETQPANGQPPLSSSSASSSNPAYYYQTSSSLRSKRPTTCNNEDSSRTIRIPTRMPFL